MSQSAEYSEKQNEMISVTRDKLNDIQRNSDALYGNVVRVSQAVEEVVTANTVISDSISNLSATSQQVAAATESSLALSDSSMDALRKMNDLLNEINVISENMMKLS
jgi:methyl-accepting chemotaxis protein